ncbi:hypothetical protein [Sporosalibacterium faouarense]|uniref:hypothetical protein n=1 Tax=Sporosalibacterium faouarense TaxID=516123 RepID=UPI00141C3265|nr:hypothetical protein [Sporosalibacterium faouarense]MTI47045.1 hypothetical protein [Bacillota bacterium]
MKKEKLLVILVIVFIFSGCSYNSKPEKFPEMPMIENMKLEVTKDDETLGNPEPITTYVVESNNMQAFLHDYEQRLINEGWKIVERRQENVIIARKNDYNAAIIAYIDNGKLKVDIRKETDKSE